MDLLTALVLAVAGWLLYAWLTRSSTQTLLDTFGAGFLPYRADMGWPRGVQEGEPISFKVSALSERGAPAEIPEPASDAGVEVIEIEGEIGAELVGIGHGHVSGGTSLRPR